MIALATIGERIKSAWNIFWSKETNREYIYYGSSYTRRPDRTRFTRGNEQSIISSIYNRIAMDCATIEIRHVKLDDNGRFEKYINSGLDECLTVEANKDQTGRAFIHDVVMSMLDEGCVGILPVDTDRNPETGSFNIGSLRTAKILEWYPDHVKVRAYNDVKGEFQDVTVAKTAIGIVENPFYSIFNEPNSTMRRLIRKLNILDVIDEQSGSGKLDLIIQLPYIIKTEARKLQAEKRRQQIEEQLQNSKYGVAYTDGTEKVTQLNRPAENNLMGQIEYLTSMLYSQSGLTQAILDGSADEGTMTNYYSRMIEPILSSIIDEMKRKFLSKTARTQKQSIEFFRDPFKLVSTTGLAELADKFTRNEILSPNEIRQHMGLIPSTDPKADELRNRNLSEAVVDEPKEEIEVKEEETSA